MIHGPASWQSLYQGRLNALIDVCVAAGNQTLLHFRRHGLTIDTKSDRSPVTVADREAEQLVRTQILQRFPEDTLQGEEFDEQRGSSSFRWIVDPIDGTKSFVCGVPLYSTLLALEMDGQSVAGAILIPALGEMAVAAMGHGCWYRSTPSGNWGRAQVSQKTELAQAVFVTSQVDSFDARNAGEAYKNLERSVWLTRSWGDGYGYLMVATGRADIMVDPVCNAWDVAAILPILTEAGGKFTDWKGEATIRGGDGVGTNGQLHQAVLDLLR
jgi:histidinol phosphatase-like enzyme (inositol monophosphatase family)